MSTEPSKSSISLHVWKRPYVWLSAAAISVIIFNIIIVAGFVRGFLLLPNILLQQYFEGRLVSENTRFQFDMTFAWVIFPITVSAGGVALLFLKKPLAGMGVTFGAIATHFVMDAIYISYVWDGHHVIQSYTHATWLVRSIQEYGGYTESIYAFNLFYIPIMTFIAICLFKGWKGIKLLQ